MPDFEMNDGAENIESISGSQADSDVTESSIPEEAIRVGLAINIISAYEYIKLTLQHLPSQLQCGGLQGRQCIQHTRGR